LIGFREEDATGRRLAADHAGAGVVGLAERQAAAGGAGLLLHRGLAVGGAAPAGAHEAATLLQQSAQIVQRVGVGRVFGAERLGLLEQPGLDVVEQRARARRQLAERDRRLLLLVAPR